MSWEIEFMPGENGFTVKPKFSCLHLGQFGDYASRWCPQMRLVVDEDAEFDIMEVADARNPKFDIEEQIANAIEWLKPRGYVMYGDVRYATSESCTGIFYVNEDGKVEDVPDLSFNPGPSWWSEDGGYIIDADRRERAIDLMLTLGAHEVAGGGDDDERTFVVRSAPAEADEDEDETGRYTNPYGGSEQTG
jgi:hypothetical protein